MGGISASLPSLDAGDIASIAAKGAATTGALLAFFAGPGSSLALAGPIGAAVAGLTAVGLSIAAMFQGCGQSCQLDSDAANKIGQYLADNLHAYFNAPVHYASLRAAALNNFDTAWNAYVAYVEKVGGPALQQSIADRQRGACKWMNDGHDGPAGSGSVCWNWFVGYRDPIANDPNVVPDPSSVLSIGANGNVVIGSTSIPSNYLEIALIILTILIVIKRKSR